MMVSSIIGQEGTWLWVPEKAQSVVQNGIVSRRWRPSFVFQKVRDKNMNVMILFMLGSEDTVNLIYFSLIALY